MSTRDDNRSWWWALGAVVLVALGVAYYLETRSESVSERLAFQPPEQAPLDPVPAGAVEPLRGSFYVPVHSHVYVGGGAPVLMAITLSVHNVDPERPVTVRGVAYYDRHGEVVRRYFETPRRLRPYQTTEIFVTALDEEGGSGANFVVDWSAEEGGRAPYVEALMFGAQGPTGYALRSQGVTITEPTAAPAPSPAPAAPTPPPSDTPAP